MTPTIVRLVRSILGGGLLAVGVALGAFNPWWAALGFGMPLILAGLALIPKATRTSELAPFARAHGAARVPATVTAMTRSTLATAAVQPTLLSVDAAPIGDTAYSGSVLVSMTRSEAAEILASRQLTLAPQLAPPRAPDKRPRFDAHPGARALLYPALAIGTAAALVVGIPATAWHIDIGLSSSSVFGSDDDAPDLTGLDTRRDAMISAITTLGAGANRNVLSMNFDPSGSDRAQVYDPDTGEMITLWLDGSTTRQDRGPTSLRRPSTFAASEVAAVDLVSMADTMTARATDYAGPLDFTELTIARRAPGAPVLITGEFENPKHITDDYTVEATPAGEIATFFRPSDFDAAFAVLQSALGEAGIGVDDPVLGRLEFRNTTRNTPIIRAGTIQNSGGILADFRTAQAYGSVVVVPGSFPVITSTPAQSTPRGFAFAQASPQVFASVQRQAIERGNVETIDHDAVDIQMMSASGPREAPVILVAVGPLRDSEGVYSVSGEFLRSGTF